MKKLSRRAAGPATDPHLVLHLRSADDRRSMRALPCPLREPPGRRRPSPRRLAPVHRDGPLSPDQRLALLGALLHADDLGAALKLARITRGAALAERASDALFALEWDRVQDVRLAEINTRLIDKVTRWLRPDDHVRPSESQDKYHIALCQWILEAAQRRQGLGAPVRAPGAPSAKGPDDRPEAAPPAPTDAAEIAALIARVEARLGDFNATARR